MVLTKVGKCSERVKKDREVSPVVRLVLLRRLRRRMRDGSPPAASIRGLMVSVAPSSRAIKTTLPWTPGVPSGMGLPVVMRAARSRVSRDLPRPDIWTVLWYFFGGLAECGGLVFGEVVVWGH